MRNNPRDLRDPNSQLSETTGRACDTEIASLTDDILQSVSGGCSLFPTTIVATCVPPQGPGECL